MEPDPTEASLQSAISDVAQEIIDEMCLGVCFEIHRNCKLGTLFLDESDPHSRKEYEIVDRVGVDVFGQVPTKKQFECICPNCSRNLAALRFAPHLEKCMGMGRNSSRIASRRIANNSALTGVGPASGLSLHKGDSDDSDGNDSDWSINLEKTRAMPRPSLSKLHPHFAVLGLIECPNYQFPEKYTVKKLRREKFVNSPRKMKNSRPRNNDLPFERASTPDENMASYENMTLESRKALLMATCGVISEHTKKMCTRSHKCPQHTDEQRRAVRRFLLPPPRLNENEEVHVDIDGYDDGDTQSLRESLQWELSSNSSPADSTSTNNSTSSRKRSKPSNKKTTSKRLMNNKGNVPSSSSHKDNIINNNNNNNNNSNMYGFI